MTTSFVDAIGGERAGVGSLSGPRSTARRSALAILILGVGACGAPPRTTTPNAGTTSVKTAPSASPTQLEAGLPPPGKHRTPLGAARATKLDVALAPVEGGGGVVAVSDAADQRWAWLAKLDEDGRAGAVLELGHAHFVAAYAGSAPGDLEVLTTEGRALCRLSFSSEGGTTTARPGVDEGHASALTRRVCSEIPSSLVVRAGDRFASIVAHVPEPDEDASPKARHGSNDLEAKPKPRPKPKSRAKKRAAKKWSHEDAKRSLFASGRTLAVTATWLDDDLAPTGDPVDTKLSFTEPMAGMGLIGGATRADRIDLAFHEKADPKGRDPQAKIGVAKLDASTLELDDGSKKAFGESKLDIGFIEGHQELRLWSDGESSLVLGTRSLRGKCDVTIAAPFVMQMIPDDGWCGVDPARFFAIGQAKRKGTPVPAASLPEAIDLAALRRAPGQAAWDVGRTVMSRGRIYGLDASGLVAWSRGTPATRAPWPLTAERLRLHWGALEPTGNGIAETDDGLVRIDEDGSVHPIGNGQARFVGGPDRAIEPARERRFAVRIGAAWVSSEGEIAQLGRKGGGAPASVADDATVLVGGETEGLVIEAVGGVLGVGSLDADGARGKAKYVASPIGAGFDAVRRRSGGALVVGPSTKDPTKVVAFAIRPDGALGPVTKLGLRGGERGVRLIALPRGGAIVLDRERTNVAWLDDDGRQLASAEHPPGASAASCVDGRPLPTHAPSIEPGKFVDVPEASERGSCITGDFAWTSRGSLRWLGSTAIGPHTRAELVDVPAFADAPPVDASPAAFAASPTRAAPRCPAEMVLVPPSLCVDRYESALADVETGTLLSPYYAATPNLMASARGDFATRRERTGDLFARALPLPALSEWQSTANITPIAIPLRDVQPSGYVTGLVARAACEAAGKRLCKLDEWRKACKGSMGAQFPYGPTYREAACNVATKEHPAALLHDNASIGHLDPRLDALSYPGAPRPFPAGSVATCASRWGDDAIYDMVGNIDEWVDEKGGAFAGGFFARGTTNGCEAIVTAHPESYLDYSTGVRCCRDAAAE